VDGETPSTGGKQPAALQNKARPAAKGRFTLKKTVCVQKNNGNKKWSVN